MTLSSFPTFEPHLAAPLYAGLVSAGFLSDQERRSGLNASLVRASVCACGRHARVVSTLAATALGDSARQREARRAVRQAISAALQTKLARRELGKITQDAAAGRLSPAARTSLLQRELADHLRRQRRIRSTHKAATGE